MKYVNLVILLMLPGLCGHARASSALAASFVCQPINGIPATVVQTKEGKRVPIIYWKSNAFTSSGWTPLKRCQEVTARFQSYHSDGSLEFITTGQVNSLPAICVAKSDGGPCTGLLYTLKPEQNAASTLMELFNIRTQPNTAPLEETTSRSYLSIDSLITNNSQQLAGQSSTGPSMAPRSNTPLF
jgi:hypothetical protein